MRRKPRNSFQKYYSIVLCTSLIFTSVMTSIPFNTYANETAVSTSKGTLEEENEDSTSTEETTPTTPEKSLSTVQETTVTETPQQETNVPTELEGNSITEFAEEDGQSYSPILITEISPNSKGSGTDYFEFIEIYNNSNQPLPLKNYSFIYQYTDGSRADLPFQVPDATVEPQKTIVLWFNNGGKTLEDFNTNFGTNLPRESVIEFTDTFPGFANGGNRAITNTLNLMDLRPGRCIKTFLFVGFMVILLNLEQAIVLLPLIIMLVASLAYMNYDLREAWILGDTGSNILGITLGYFCSISLGDRSKLALFIILFGINILAEKVSISKLIANNRLLSYLDNLGRSSG